MFLALRPRSLYGTRPLTTTSPSVGCSTPVSILMVVDFPAPLGPRYPTSSPRSISNEILSTARISWYSDDKRVLIPPKKPGRLLTTRNVFERSWA